MELITKPGDPGYVEPGSKEYARHLGCSEVAAVLGFDQFGRTANDIWMAKTHRAPDTEHKRIFSRGHSMEPHMASMLATDFGRVVKCQQLQYRHPDHPWLIFHADGMFSKWTALQDGAKAQEGFGVCEFKAPGSHVAEQFKKDGMSSGYVCQIQTGLMVAQAAMGEVINWGTAAFLDYDRWELVPFDMEANADFQQNALETLVKFWECVESDTPPTPINPLQNVMPPSVQGELEIIDDERIRTLANDLRGIMGPLKAAKDASDILKAQLKEALGEYSKAEVPGVMKFSYGYGRPKETINGKGLLAYCEHLVGALNNATRMVNALDLDQITEVAFRREDWVKTSPPTRSFRPTAIEEF